MALIFFNVSILMTVLLLIIGIHLSFVVCYFTTPSSPKSARDMHPTSEILNLCRLVWQKDSCVCYSHLNQWYILVLVLVVVLVLDGQALALYCTVMDVPVLLLLVLDRQVLALVLHWDGCPSTAATGTWWPSNGTCTVLRQMSQYCCYWYLTAKHWYLYCTETDVPVLLLLVLDRRALILVLHWDGCPSTAATGTW